MFCLFCSCTWPNFWFCIMQKEKRKDFFLFMQATSFGDTFYSKSFHTLCPMEPSCSRKTDTHMFLSLSFCPKRIFNQKSRRRIMHIRLFLIQFSYFFLHNVIQIYCFIRNLYNDFSLTISFFSYYIIDFCWLNYAYTVETGEEITISLASPFLTCWCSVLKV